MLDRTPHSDEFWEGEDDLRAVADLAEAVPAICVLRQLTRLRVRLNDHHLNVGGDQLPPSGLAALIASLPQLQLLDWCCWDDGEALPIGPALASLRRLHAPVQALARSLPALARATQLEALQLTLRADVGGTESRALCDVLRWAPAQPALRRVSLGFAGGGTVATEVLGAALAAQRAAPSLHIGLGVEGFDSEDG